MCSVRRLYGREHITQVDVVPSLFPEYLQFPFLMVHTSLPHGRKMREAGWALQRLLHNWLKMDVGVDGRCP
jgi:hypothetical protein